jgi:hypothetical protein
MRFWVSGSSLLTGYPSFIESYDELGTD